LICFTTKNTAGLQERPGESQAVGPKENKKIEIMLTRRAKAYSSSCSQTVRLSPTTSWQFIVGVCAAAEDHKNQ